MTAVNPVAPQSVALPGTVGAAQQEMPLTFEQKLLDYIARHQAEGLARGQHLGNPAALGGEALKSLKGYFERATALQESWARKAHVVSENREGMKPAGGGLQLASLPGGPASDRMEPVMPKSGSGEKIASVSDAELDRTVDALMQIMHFTVETNMLTSATHNVSKSVMTLIHGQ
jgi:hypothetical protein